MNKFQNEKEFLTLSNAKIAFYNDGKSGQYDIESIAIDVSGPNGQYMCDKIEKWYKDNNINNGKPHYNYGPNGDEKLINFKLGKYTMIRDLNERPLGRSILENGLTVSFVAKAVPYNNGYGEGITHYIQLIEVHNPEESNGKKYHEMIKQDRMATKSYSENNKTEAIASSESDSKNENTKTKDDDVLDPTTLDDVPF